MSSRDQWDIIDWKIRCSELAFMIEDLENRKAELESDRRRLQWLVINAIQVLREGE